MKSKKSTLTPLINLSILALAMVAALGVYAVFFKDKAAAPPQESSSQSSEGEGQNSTPAPLQTGGYSGMWVSYLEFEGVDFSSEAAFKNEIIAVFENCRAMGLSTVIVQVRPFGDALYPSQIFPWSHLITGTQGVDPGYDPLEIMVSVAHEKGLRFEAWVNPYRVQLTKNKPADLSAGNPAVQNPTWVTAAENGLYYSPSLAQVQELVVAGVREIIQNYEVDGIQFDDYFYPTVDEEFDAQYLPAGQELAAWRRENVNSLVRKVYAAIKEENTAVTFGISPQGNTDNNYTQQYSDVALWMREGGYVDYVMPQIYWGFDYETSSGSTRFAFENCVNEWLSLPRAQGVQLYIGLGAYRVGAGDGSAAQSAGEGEWYTGENLAAQARALKALRADGFAIYRYASLFSGVEPYATQEINALRELLLNP